MRREVLDRTTTPAGEPLELDRMGKDYFIRVGGVLLMSSAVHGSEQLMAEVALEALGARATPRVLVGGLGMGYTLRAVLDTFPAESRVTVAELLEPVVRYNQGPLAHLADRPLDDPRVELVQGDVRDVAGAGRWDAILLDVDNGPEALTVPSNARLYGQAGLQLLKQRLTRGAVIVVWSASESAGFERSLRQAGFRVEARRVRARGRGKKGPRHVLFIATKP